MRILRFEFLLLGLFLVLVIGAKLLRSSAIEETSVSSSETNIAEESLGDLPSSAHLIVLGIAQDAGYPQADCKKSCCSGLWYDKRKRKMVSCLGLRIPQSKQVYLFDATTDIKDQLHLIKNQDASQYELGGIFLTHAHMGGTILV